MTKQSGRGITNKRGYGMTNKRGCGMTNDRTRNDERKAAGSGGEPGEGVGEEALLEDGVEVGDSVVEDFCFA